LRSHRSLNGAPSRPQNPFLPFGLKIHFFLEGISVHEVRCAREKSAQREVEVQTEGSESRSQNIGAISP
jgi:hypothetical protein